MNKNNLNNPILLTDPSALNNIRSSLGRAVVFSALALFALSPRAQAVTPAPDGGYQNGNTAEGELALFSLPSNGGGDNTAIGVSALYSNTNGGSNTATGAGALESNTDGTENTAIGAFALVSNTTPDGNTAVGSRALEANTNGSSNTALGSEALNSNTSGNNNTASGFEALFSNTGNNNMANGWEALFNNTNGYNNTASGFQALFSNTTAFNNVATGSAALYSNSTGTLNTASGAAALYHNIGGSNNTAEGGFALVNNKGSNNTALGAGAGMNLTTGSNNVDIGANVPAVAGEANTIRIGKQGTQKATFIAGISGVAVSGSQVIVNSSGKLGVATSSARFKEAVKPMDKASEAILELKPVTFRYKEGIDPDGTPQFGLVAEEVEKVNPDLVGRDHQGKVNTVRYEAVNAMVLNEFLKEHRRVEALEATVAQQQKDFQAKLVQQQKDFESKAAQQQKQIDALAATVQKVSNQLELAKAVPQLAANHE